MFSDAYDGVTTKGGSYDIIIAWNTFDTMSDRGVNAGGFSDDPYFRPPLSSTSSNAEARRIYIFANKYVLLIS